MGIYYYAVDFIRKEMFSSPKGFADKAPGIYHKNNPFPCMVVMKNIRGSDFRIINDMGSAFERCCSECKDITDEVFLELKEEWPEEWKNEI